MEEYKGNSHRSKQEEDKEPRKKLDKVVTGVKIKKKGAFQRALGMFFESDSKSVGSYIFSEVVIPWLQDAFVDSVSRAANMLVHCNDDYSRSYHRRDSNTIPYHKKYRSEDDRTRDRDYPRRVSKPRDYVNDDDISFETQGDAEYVLDCLYDVLKKYKIVRVADLYDLIGQECPYTLQRYGWASLDGARVIRMRRDEYKLDLPRAMVID